jgi:HAD superfamily hydrolase (TIGR01509 family)
LAASTTRPHAVVFDNDGLLLDTEELWTRAQRELFARHGREFTPEHKLAFVGVSRPAAAWGYEGLLGAPGRGKSLLDELHENALEEAADGAEPMPGARELTAALLAAGVPLGLVSNSPREWVDAVLGPCGLAPRFATILTPDDGFAHKPEPALYLEACRRLAAEPSSSVGLEDTATGLAAVKAAGMTAIGIPAVSGVELDGADLVAPSLADAAVWEALGLTP